MVRCPMNTILPDILYEELTQEILAWSGICFHLFICLFSDFAQQNMALFARFIPNLLPATQPQDIETLAAETQKYQNDLMLNQGFSR